MDHKICFYGEIIWFIIPKLSLLPLLIWSTGFVNISSDSKAYETSECLENTVRNGIILISSSIQMLALCKKVSLRLSITCELSSDI